MEDKEILKKVKDEELPEALRTLSPEKRPAYVQEMAAKRGAIQKQINDLSASARNFSLLNGNDRLARQAARLLGMRR